MAIQKLGLEATHAPAPGTGYVAFYPIGESIYGIGTSGVPYLMGGPGQATEAFDIIRATYTGTFEGGVVTINDNDATKIDMSTGAGQHVDPYTTPGTPVKTPVAWPARLSVSVDYLATDPSSIIAIDIAGEIAQFRINDFGPERIRNYLQQAILVHPGATVTGVIPAQRSAYGREDDTEDHKEAVGPISLQGQHYNQPGMVISANGASLGLTISPGFVQSPGGNRGVSNSIPSRINFAGASPTGLIFHTYRNGVGGFHVSGTPGSVLLPGAWDDGSNLLASVPADKFTLMPVFLFPSNANVIVHYGQALYNSIGEAFWAYKQAVALNPLVFSALFLGSVIVRGDATSLLDTTAAMILPSDKNGSSRNVIAPVYGSYFQEVTDRTYRPVPSATFDVVASLTTEAPLPPGKYEIRFEYVWSHNNSNNSNFQCQVWFDETGGSGTPINLYAQTPGAGGDFPMHRQEPADNGIDQRHVVPMFTAFVTLTDTVNHTINMKISSSGGNIAAVHLTTISLHRVL